MDWHTYHAAIEANAKTWPDRNHPLTACARFQTARIKVRFQPSLGCVELRQSEQDAVNAIYAACKRDASCGGRSEVNVKLFKVERVHLNSVSVVIEMGGVNDAGTLAAVVCRTRGHFFIGPRGGIKSAGLITPMGARAKKAGAGNLKRHPLIYGWNV